MIAFHRAFEMGHERRTFDREVIVVFHGLISAFLNVLRPHPEERALRASPRMAKSSFIAHPSRRLLRKLLRMRVECAFDLRHHGLTYSARARRHPARLPSSSRTASDAGRWCASALLRWSPDSSRPHSPGSAP